MHKTLSIVVAGALGLGLAASPALVDTATAATRRPKPPVHARQHSYDAIAGSYLVRANAIRQVARLRAKGFAGFGIVVRAARGKTWFVVLRTFSNKADAAALVAQVRRAGVASYLLSH